MRGRVRAPVAILLAALGVSPLHLGAQQDPARLDKVGAYLRSLETVGFSGAVAVEASSGDVLEEGYGPRDRETGATVDAQTVFTLGSVTKQFTATAILLLREDGLLRLTDSLPAFFDGVPPDKRPITIHQLLTHTSGLPDVLGGDWDLTATRDWVVSHALSSGLQSAPGTEYHYSNLGYSLLAAIIEIVSSRDYERFLRERLFIPSGMEHTGYVLPGFDRDQLAVGYDEGSRWGTVLERPMLDDGPSWNLRGNGGMHTTVGDMLKWHHALRDEEIIPGAVLKRLGTRYVDEGGGDSYYGYGWSLYEGPGGTHVMGHDGGNGIFSADLRRYLEDGGFLVIFSSTPDFPAPSVADGVQAILYDTVATAPHPKVTAVPREELIRLAGRYVLGAGDTLVVSPEDRTLRIRATGCWGSYLMSGGGDRPTNAAELARRSVRAMSSAAEGDLRPFRELLPAEYNGRALDVQRRYNRIQETSGLGAFAGADLYRCMPDGDQLKVVTRLRYRTGTWYRSLRWRGDRLSGYGIHEYPPGGLQSTVLVPQGNDDYRSFALEEQVVSHVHFTESGELVVQRSDGAAIAAARKRN